MAKKEIKAEKNKKSKKEEKNKRHFFKDFKAELKKVVWPTPKQLVNNTIAVITIVLVIALIVFILDMGFDFINRKNAQLQSVLQSKYSNNTSADENITTSDETDDASSEVTNVEVDTTTEETE